MILTTSMTEKIRESIKDFLKFLVSHEMCLYYSVNSITHLTQGTLSPVINGDLSTIPGWRNPRHAMNDVAMLTQPDRSGWVSRSLFQQA